MSLLKKTVIFLALTAVLSCTVFAGSLVTERQIYDFLTGELQLPSSSACGILANVEHESDFDLHTLGDNGTSFGLFQWHNERWRALRAFCLAKGLDEGTLQGQLQYLKYELETDYPELLTLLRAMEDTPNGAYGAGYLWCVQFERPSDMEAKGRSRGALARGKYWNRYHNALMQKEEEPPTREELQIIIRQEEVSIPQPPEPQIVPEEKQQSGITPDFVYLPRLVPKPTPPKEEPAPMTYPSSLAFLCALTFMPVILPSDPNFLPEPHWEEMQV